MDNKGRPPKQAEKNSVENIDNAESIRKLKNIINIIRGHGKYSILK